MTEQQQRFDRHILDNYSICLNYGHLSLEKEGDGSYVHGDTNGWWIVWQAAEAPLLERIAELERQLAERKFVVELPELAIGAAMAGSCCAESFNDGIERCKEAILAAGGEVR